MISTNVINSLLQWKVEMAAFASASLKVISIKRVMWWL